MKCQGPKADAPVFYEILEYLARHPDAQDTLEGVVEWWWFNQRIASLRLEVEKALLELERNGLILTSSGSDGRVRYRVNPSQEQTIRSLLKARNTSDDGR